jgi:hypothetical protein
MVAPELKSTTQSPHWREAQQKEAISLCMCEDFSFELHVIDCEQLYY